VRLTTCVVQPHCDVRHAYNAAPSAADLRKIRMHALRSKDARRRCAAGAGPHIPSVKEQRRPEGTPPQRVRRHRGATSCIALQRVASRCNELHRVATCAMLQRGARRTAGARKEQTGPMGTDRSMRTAADRSPCQYRGGRRCRTALRRRAQIAQPVQTIRANARRALTCSATATGKSPAYSFALLRSDAVRAVQHQSTTVDYRADRSSVGHSDQCGEAAQSVGRTCPSSLSSEGSWHS
jgi:hypothetical protein